METNSRSKNEWRFVAAARPPRNRFATGLTRKSASKLQRKRCPNQRNNRRSMASEALMLQVGRRIYLLRGEKVMLASDLAALYGVSTSALNQAVRRNKNRFPSDFMFQLNAKEWKSLKSHFVTSKRGGVRRALPYAFTEHGVAMLSSVLTSDRAAAVNIAIMR